jgi:hypothetical protein
MTASVFLSPRRLADDQGGAGGVALGEHQMAGGIAQRAAIEGCERVA